MTESKSVETEALAKYYPERDYPGKGYKPYGEPFPDLCKSCDHYYEFLQKKGMTKKAFPPICDRHISEQLKGLTEEDFEPEEYEELIIAADPVAWALHTFAWEARWYQEEMMSCTARKKVVRAGRRTGKTLCISVLATWMLATMANCSILIIAPYEVQVIKIFDEIDKLVAASPELTAAIKRRTRNPCRLEFNNGSKAIGFSSGSNSTAGSDKIRGQDANYIIIDEADYINQMDIDAILAILASHPDCGLWASSTPTGLHQKFHQFCVQKDLGFKEFWYISAEAPNWTQEVEDFLKISTDSTTYEHEYYAEFGIQEAGVFRNDLIDSALMNYTLPRGRTPGSRVIIGADWNGQAIGTHIVVTEAVLDMKDNLKYVVLEKLVVKGTEFTQHSAVKKIIDLNKRYDPAFIYVDSGYGETQIEMLHKHGKEHPETKLHEKVKGYSMQSKIEITDPLSNIKVKKNAKPFMVNMSVMQLEQNRIVLPVSEDTSVLVDTLEGDGVGGDQGLVQQMRNFSIERISSSGLPSYSQGEDHTLTAWMLSIVGFVIEMSDLTAGHVRYVPILHLGDPEAEKKEDHADVKLAEITRQVDKGTNFGKHSNMSSLAKAITDGKKLEQAIKSGNKDARNSYFRNSPISRNSNLGKRTKMGNSGRSSF